MTITKKKGKPPFKRTLRPGNRVKCMRHEHPCYGSVGTVKKVLDIQAIVLFDHHGPNPYAVDREWLQRVWRSKS